MNTTEQKLTATSARELAKEISVKCSECFGDKVRARKFFGQWVIDINGGRAACYGKTLNTVEDAEDTIRIFGNSL